jgi:hypothetical protein
MLRKLLEVQLLFACQRGKRKVVATTDTALDTAAIPATTATVCRSGMLAV